MKKREEKEIEQQPIEDLSIDELGDLDDFENMSSNFVKSKLDYEEDYFKQKSMEVAKETEMEDLLPIRKNDGKIEVPRAKRKREEEEEEENEIVSGPKENPNKKKKKDKKSKSEMPHEYVDMGFKEMKLEIAQLATEILQDPVSNMKNLRKLLVICKEAKNYQIQQLGALSLLALFIDLIPDYRINLDSMSEDVIHKKDVEESIQFERSLLSSYQDYLQFLHFKKDSKHLSIVSLKCMCELLLKKSHFNFRSNIIKTVVPYLSHQDEKIGNLCYEYISQVFRNDKICEVSSEIVEEICEFILNRKYKIHERVLNTLLSLNLTTILEEDQKMPVDFSFVKKIKKKLAHTNHRTKSFQQEILRDSLKLNGQSSNDELKQNQTVILKNILVCYIRLLKNDPQSPLLFSSLAGLGKFAHLMNVDLLYDLLQYMKIILEYGEMPLNTSLQTIITSSKLKLGLGDALNLDFSDYYIKLYQLLPFCNDANSRLYIDALYSLLVKPKKLPKTRVAAFIKRMLTISLNTSLNLSIPLVHMSKFLLGQYPGMKELLSGEESGLGEYNQDAENPDNSNPFSTNLWEYSLLVNYFDIHDIVLSDAIKQLNSSEYQEIITEYENLFNINWKEPKCLLHHQISAHHF
eukprot:gene1391-12011_t